MARVTAALHLLPPRRGVLRASWPVVYGQGDVSRWEGREDDLVEAPRERKNNHNNKIHIKLNTFACTEGYNRFHARGFKAVACEIYLTAIAVLKTIYQILEDFSKETQGKAQDEGIYY